MNFKKDEQFLIRDHAAGEIVVKITKVNGSIINFENSKLNYSGSVHESIFIQVIIEKVK